MKYKRSKQRERMLELLGQTEIHPTADWLYQELKKEFPSLSLGTVYRNLNILVEQKLIQKLPFGSTHDRYEAQKSPHYHLVCEECGSVQDFDIPQYTRINEQVQKMSNFKISRHRIDFFGTCEKCQNKKRNPKRNLTRDFKST
jgi:Fur family transcriptional regulator, peroxide stress response regulator